MFEKIPKESLLLNLLNSHDTARILTTIQNTEIIKTTTFDFGSFFNETLASSNKNLILTKTDNNSIKIMIAFQMFFPGSPLIYYGDECGMWGANDPDCKKPMLWDDMIYDDEKGENTINSVECNKTIMEFYQKIIELRNKEIAYKEGVYKTMIFDDKKLIFGFLRENDKESVDIIFNNDTQVEETILKEDEHILFLNEKENYNFEYTTNEKKEILILDAKSFLIFKKYFREICKYSILLTFIYYI